MAPPDLASLKRLRGAIKGATTRALAGLDDFLTSATLVSIIGKKNAVEKNLRKVINYDDQISMLTDAADLEREADDSLTYISGLEESLATIQEKINELQCDQTSKSIKLPSIQLPNFSGEVTEWTRFWDLFESAIHNKRDLSSIQKLTYLKGQLTGQARALVEGIKVESANYTVCVDLLKSTYGHVSVIKASHVQNLLDLPTPGYTITELTEFRASFECHLRSLDILNLTKDELFSIVLMNKLPKHFREVVKRAAGENWLQLDTFREVFQREIENMRTFDNQTPFNERALATASFALSNETKVQSRSYSFCKLCKGAHIWFRCSRYTDADSKINQIKRLQLCLICLDKSHFATDCKANLRPCIYCNGRHFHHLCTRSKCGKKETSERVKSIHALSYSRGASPSDKNQVDKVGKPSSWSRTTAILSTIKIPLISKGNKPVNCRAFLDQGSQVSFIHRKLLNLVKWENLGQETLKLRTYHHLEEDKTYQIVRVFFNYKGKECTIECFVDESLPDSQRYKGLGAHLSKFKAQGIRLADDYADNAQSFELLLGLDNYYNIVHPGFRRQGELILLPTKFGYALSGKYFRRTETKQTHVVSVLKVATDFSDRYLESDTYVESGTHYSTSKDDLSVLWELDHLGITQNEIDSDSRDALSHFHENIEFSDVDQQYVVRLPWKTSPDVLPTNFGMALGRLKGLQKRFLKDSKFCSDYSQIISDQESRGFIERVQPDDHKHACHYLSHHGILKDSPTTPIRTVFDCSAKINSSEFSLNDCLHTGPSLVTDIGHFLIRLRLHKYLALGDIEKAFLMIKLHILDRDYTRFLWFEDPMDPNSKLITYRFAVVLFGATCSQFLLNATILHHLSDLNDCDFLKVGLYVDNLQITADSADELLTQYWTAQQVFSSAHLFLREWITNSPSLLDQLNLDGTMAENQSMVKVMGMRWWPESDHLGFHPSLQNLGPDVIHRPTKRSLLSIVSRVFDPLGLLLPVTIRSRILLQEIWRRRIDWDEYVPKDLLEEWKVLIYDLRDSLIIKLPRQVNPVKTTRCNFHVFADASKTAYGCSLYAVTEEGSRLVISKARVAPMKGLTIPKMELTAVLMAARLLSFTLKSFTKEVNIDRCFVWSDSQIVLYWLQTKNTVLPIYVRNRVDEIRLLIPMAVFRYVPTQDNPADLVTRGQSAVVLSDSELWWHGPSWLPSRNLWPQWSGISEDLQVPLVDTNVCLVDNVDQLAVAAIKPRSQVLIFDWMRYSTFERLKRVVCWIMRFKLNLCRATKGDNIETSSYLTITELKSAEMKIVGLVQSESFSQEISHLRDGKGNSTMLIRQLNLYWDRTDGFLHCRGRLKFAQLDDSVKYPILLPRTHRVTELIIERAHRYGLHYGVNYIVTVLRQCWWIPRMRQTVKSVIGKCIICKRWQTRAFPTIGPPDLPNFRVTRVEPFAITGVDYTGAVNIRTKLGVHPTSKVYIVLFTCAVTRAVHVEIAEDLTCSSFLHVFRRFCGRRSVPNCLLSDNATYFTAAAKYIKEVMSCDEVIEYLNGVGCQWKFIPARAPWFGAIWERCIGIVKAGMHKVLGRALVTYDELNTLLIELEATVNDRPLTYSSGDVEDPEALTPSHLLCGRRLRPYPLLTTTQTIDDPDFVLRQSGKVALQERYRHVSKISNDLWRRWSSEYLTMLREGQRHHVSKTDPWPITGEVVLLGDEGSRLYWKLGIVIKVFSGGDGKTRVVQLKTSTGNTIRPVVNLYPLELHVKESHTSTSNDLRSDRINSDDNRPTRMTAQAARQMWQDRIGSGQL